MPVGRVDAHERDPRAINDDVRAFIESTLERIAEERRTSDVEIRNG